MRSRSRRVAFLMASLAAVAACDRAVTAGPDILAGHAHISVSDTGSTPAGPLVAGDFRGAVYGVTSGPDSVDVPLSNVRVAAYLRTAGVTSTTVTAETTSDAAGVWELPTLPAGEYAVTFEPAAGSAYRSGYTIASTAAVSGYWTVMLPKK